MNFETSFMTLKWMKALQIRYSLGKYQGKYKTTNLDGHCLSHEGLDSTLYFRSVFKNYLAPNSSVWNTNRLNGSREPQTLFVYPNDSRLSILAMQKLQQLFIYVSEAPHYYRCLRQAKKGGAYCLQVRWNFSCVLKMAPAYNHLETNIIHCSQPQRNWSYRTDLLSTSLGVFIQFFLPRNSDENSLPPQVSFEFFSSSVVFVCHTQYLSATVLVWVDLYVFIIMLKIKQNIMALYCCIFHAVSDSSHTVTLLHCTYERFLSQSAGALTRTLDFILLIAIQICVPFFSS